MESEKLKKKKSDAGDLKFVQRELLLGHSSELVLVQDIWTWHLVKPGNRIPSKRHIVKMPGFTPAINTLLWNGNTSSLLLSDFTSIFTSFMVTSWCLVESNTYYILCQRRTNDLCPGIKGSVLQGLKCAKMDLNETLGWT